MLAPVQPVYVDVCVYNNAVHSAEDLSDPASAPGLPERSVNVRLAQDDVEGAIQGLGLGLCAQNAPGSIEFALI